MAEVITRGIRHVVAIASTNNKLMITQMQHARPQKGSGCRSRLSCSDEPVERKLSAALASVAVQLARMSLRIQHSGAAEGVPEAAASGP